MDRGISCPQSNGLPQHDTVDSSPLLGRSQSNASENQFRRLRHRSSLRGAAWFLRRAGNHQMIREPSMRVRETAAEQLEVRQSDWAYSRPVVVLDLLWNLTFVAVACVILILSRNELPSVPLRLWVLGYALQCILHMVCVCMEYKRRRGVRSLDSSGHGAAYGRNIEGRDGQEDERDHDHGSEQALDDGYSFAKNLESMNTMFSFIWWIVGFYWISAGGQPLAHNAPRLYWLSIVFLAFDVFFVVFCVALACAVGVAVCCCLPCIITILYAVAEQEGITEDDLRRLPKYKFYKGSATGKISDETSGPFVGVMRELHTDLPAEHVLSVEDAECCICLSAYEDGVELRELPCGHHFHCTCIDKWLYINATCPLCKFSLTKTAADGIEEV